MVEFFDFLCLPGRLRLEWISSAAATKFVQVMTEFTEQIKALGQSPGRLCHLHQRQRGQAAGRGGRTRVLRLCPAPFWGAERRGGGERMNAMNEQVTDWLTSGTVDIFLGYKLVDGHPLPYAFSRDNLEEVREMVTGPARYPLEKLAVEISAVRPEVKIGILGRDCNRRALNVLTIHQQAAPGQVKVLDMSCCPSLLKEQAQCSSLQPQIYGAYKKQVGIDNAQTPDQVATLAPADRFSRWMYEFEKCLKCYGCRDICPMCFCKECALEHPDLMSTGKVELIREFRKARR